MSARDDYRILAEAAISGQRASVNAHELAAALDELDQLRQDLRAERAVRANIEAQLQDLLAHDPG